MTDTEETMTPAEAINALSPEEAWERYVGDQSRAEFADNSRQNGEGVSEYAEWAIREWHPDATATERDDAEIALSEKLRACLAADGIELD